MQSVGGKLTNHVIESLVITQIVLPIDAEVVETFLSGDEDGDRSYWKAKNKHVFAQLIQ